MARVEYGNGGRRNFIFVLEATDGMRWRKMAGALREGGCNRGQPFLGLMVGANHSKSCKDVLN